MRKLDPVSPKPLENHRLFPGHPHRARDWPALLIPLGKSESEKSKLGLTRSRKFLHIETGDQGKKAILPCWERNLI